MGAVRFVKDSTQDASGRSDRQSLFKSVVWVLAFRIFDRAAGFVSILILARLLVPAHFGLVALATAVVALVELLGSLGLDTVLIQRRSPSKAHYDTAWTIQLAVAGVCAAVIAAAASSAATFLGQPTLESLIQVLAGATAIGGLTNIRMVQFRKHMRFDKEFLYLATRRLLTTAVTIVSAAVLRNEWALVIGILSGKCFGVFLSYRMRPYIPSLSLARLSEFRSASGWLLVIELVIYARTRASDFVLGRISGPAVVGTFNLANEVAMMTTTELAAAVNRAALPNFSAIPRHEDRLRRFESVLGLLSLAVIPASAGLSACAQPIVDLLFGPNWTSAGPVLEIAAFAWGIGSLGSTLGTLMTAMGLFKWNSLHQVAVLAVMLPLLIAGTYLFGPIGAAWAFVVANCFYLLSGAVLLRMKTGFGLSRFARSLWRPAIAATLMWVLVDALRRSAQVDKQAHFGLAFLAMYVLAGVASYTVAIWLLNRGRFSVGSPEHVVAESMRLTLSRIGQRLRPKEDEQR